MPGKQSKDFRIQDSSLYDAVHHLSRCFDVDEQQLILRDKLKRFGLSLRLNPCTLKGARLNQLYSRSDSLSHDPYLMKQNDIRLVQCFSGPSQTLYNVRWNEVRLVNQSCHFSGSAPSSPEMMAQPIHLPLHLQKHQFFQSIFI